LLADPRHFDALHLLGVLACQSGNPARALGLIDQAIQLYPANPVFYASRGNALKDLRRFTEAVASYDEAIARKADFAEAYSNRGIALKEIHQLDAAVASFDKAIELKADYAEAWSNRGNALRLAGKYEMAVASYNKAIALKPDYVDAYSNRGNAFRDMRDAKMLDKALTSYEMAIALRPDFAEACSNRGNVLRDLGLLESSIASYDRAIAIAPDFAEAYSNRGLALKEMSRLDEALACYETALALKPDFVDGNWNKSLVLLLGGQLEEGWKYYEWRWKNLKAGLQRREFPQPLWTGAEPLQGKTILLQCEQGFGDSIQFVRYARLVAERGAKVIVEVPVALAGLFKGVEGVSALALQGTPLPSFDYHCPLMSLPLAFNTGLGSIPVSPRYLKATAEKLQAWEKKLGPKTALRVGLAWSGSTTHRNDRQRSTLLSTLLQYLPPQHQYVSLQKEVRAADQPALNFNRGLLHFGSELKDFTDTAALVNLMDVVISVDTSVAHLSGALGKKTWVMLPVVPDWRWLLDRDDSPWYPSVTCYRQTTRDDWTTVFARVGADLLKPLA
jgi:tetratricopeptide (TPR) repeat protein